MLGETVLMEFMHNGSAWYMFLVRSGRSSGRFFWVTALILLIVALFLLHRYYGSRKSIWFLSFIILIQYADLSLDGFLVASNKRDYVSPLDASSREQIMSCYSVKFLTEFDMKVAEFSLLNKKMLNKFQLARKSGDLTQTRLKKEREDFNHLRFDKKSLYIFDSPMDLAPNIIYSVHDFYAGKLSVTPAYYRSKEHGSVKIRHKANDSLATLIRHIKSSALVLIAVKNDGSHSMPGFFKHQIDSICKSKLTELGFKNSYIAVFSYGKLIREKIDVQQAVEDQFSVFGNEFFIKSAGYDCGNEAIIKVNGIDLSMNETGLNVLVLEGDVWNCYDYDTYGKEFSF